MSNRMTREIALINASTELITAFKKVAISNDKELLEASVHVRAIERIVLERIGRMEVKDKSI